jgi:hypothetical protein
LTITLAFTLIFTFTLGRVARAEEPSDKAKEEAATRFERGVKLFDAQDYAAALAEFEAAHRLVPRYQVLFNIGVTEKRLFRYNDAVRTLKRYLDEGGDKVPPISEDRRQQVDRELSEIRALVAEVTVKVDGLPASVDVDGRTMGDTPLSGPLLLPSGHHVVTANREGYDPARKEIDVVSGEKVEVALSPKLKPKIATTAKLTIASHPNGADLTLDGKALGIEPWTGNLQPGGHEIKASLKGYVTAKQEALLTAGQVRTVTVELSLIPPPPKWYRRWYTWTIVAVLVAGAAGAGVGGYIATHPGPDYSIQFPK